MTDLNMPVTSGLDILKAARESQENCGLVLMSGNIEAESKRFHEAKNIAHKIIAKPFDELPSLFQTLLIELKELIFSRQTWVK